MVQKSLAIKSTSNRFKTFGLILYEIVKAILLLFVPRFLYKRKDVKNQIVLITGGGSGIGQLVALRFLRLGSKVIIWDVNKDGMEMTKKMAEEEKLNVNNLFIYQVDITNRHAVYHTADKVKQEVGIVDILINNAGVVSGTNLMDIPDEKIELTFKVNSISHFYMLKAFLPDMIKRDRGHICTIASVAGLIGVCSLSDYCASKYANVGMDYALRMEIAKANLNIKTTIVKPYFIQTGMFNGANPGFFPLLQPEYVANEIVDAILTETIEITIPWYMKLLALLELLPLEAIVPLYDFIGGYEWMENFHGRQLPPSTKNIEINNNNNNNINNNGIGNNNKIST